MKCSRCGKEFVTEYWEGGYIDHVVNFSENRDVNCNREDAEEMAREIIFSGNDVRQARYIKERLGCYLTWEEVSKEKKARVNLIVNAMVKGLEEAEKRVNQIEKKESPIVLAMLKEENIDESFFDLFDECCGKG
jgi:hypothetical protein